MTTKASENVIAYTVKGDNLATEGILDGYTLTVDREAEVKPGELALLYTPDGEMVARRATGEDDPTLIIGRVIQSYVIPQDSKYLILRNLKRY
jgi:SOS-response transcriptional repressor LexA